jgi:hypothetical protein
MKVNSPSPILCFRQQKVREKQSDPQSPLKLTNPIKLKKLSIEIPPKPTVPIAARKTTMDKCHNSIL